MQRIVALIHSVGAVLVGLLLGMAASALAAGDIGSAAVDLPGPHRAVRVEITHYDMGRNGRSIRSIDLTVRGDLSRARSITYTLGEDGLWSEKCVLDRSDHRNVATASDCRAPAGSAAADVTSITVVLAD